MSTLPAILTHRLDDLPAFFYWTAQGRYAWVALVAVCLVYVLGARRGARAPRLFFTALVAATAALAAVTAAMLRLPPGPASLAAALCISLAYSLPAALLSFLAKRAPRALPVILGLSLALVATDAAARLAYVRLIGDSRSLFTDFSQALRANDLEAARQCVKDGLDPAKPPTKLQGGWLHFVVDASPAPAPALEFLIEQGLPVNQRDQEGATPLFLAAAKGDARSAALFLAYGADPNIPGPQGLTPLAAARKSGFHDLAAALLGKGAREK